MEKALKTTGRSFFFLLLTAVALRPVIVEASTAYPPSTVSAPQACSFAQSHSPQTCPILTRQPSPSNLRVIPKEVLDTGLLTPPVSKLKFCPDRDRRPAVLSVFRGFSPRNFLVLRI